MLTNFGVLLMFERDESELLTPDVLCPPSKVKYKQFEANMGIESLFVKNNFVVNDSNSPNQNIKI